MKISNANPFGFKRSPQQKTFTKPAVYHQRKHLIIDPDYMSVSHDEDTTRLSLSYCAYDQYRGKWHQDTMTMDSAEMALSLLQYGMRITKDVTDRIGLMGVLLRIKQIQPSDALLTCAERERPLILALLS